MKVLGIDPGTLTSGFGIVQEEGHRIFYIESGGITASSKLSFPERLKKIYDGVERLIVKHQPDMVSMESLFFAKNVQSALKLGHARGVALLAVVNHGIPVFEYSPTEIKQAVVGFGAADKAQVQQMVKTLLNLETLPKPYDASDALAAAICHIHSGRMREVIRKSPAPPSRGRAPKKS